jgi:hypothetical protein
MLDRRLVEEVADRLGADKSLVEKDWHVVRAIGVLAALDHGNVAPAFSGGTSLSKGWDLIKRFSEDIDFKVGMVPGASRSKDRARRKAYGELVRNALAAAAFEPIGDVVKRDEHRFFQGDFAFISLFETGRGMRPHLRIEMSFMDPALPPIVRPVQSLIGRALRHQPEVVAFPCIDPVETAADKLSALAWRVCTRERGSQRDDPTIIRHLHDLAALSDRIRTSDSFRALALKAVADDTSRGGGTAPAAARDRFARMVDRLKGERFWAGEYEEYVRGVSFAELAERITFESALDAVIALVDGLYKDQPA